MTPPYRPTIVAHRGWHAEHPENSIAAFRAAWSAGIVWCECDVQMTRDFTPVVLHDLTLDRTTDHTGPIDQANWWDVGRARLRRDDGSITDETLPAFEFAIDAMAGFNKQAHRAKLLVEIKAPCRRELYAGVMDKAGCCAVQSFDANVLMRAHIAARKIPVYLLIELSGDLIATVDRNLSAPWQGLNIEHDALMPALVERIRAAGKQVGAWTPNTGPDLERVIAMRVDTIITDEPLRAMEILRQLDLPGAPSSE